MPLSSGSPPLHPLDTSQNSLSFAVIVRSRGEEAANYISRKELQAFHDFP